MCFVTSNPVWKNISCRECGQVYHWHDISLIQSINLSPTWKCSRCILSKRIARPLTIETPATGQLEFESATLLLQLQSGMLLCKENLSPVTASSGVSFPDTPPRKEPVGSRLKWKFHETQRRSRRVKQMRKHTIEKVKRRSKQQDMTAVERHFFVAGNDMSKGSLDITCRRVVRALQNKKEQLSSRGRTVFQFQAARLSDNIKEVRRRVYDVLPVMEALGAVTKEGRLYDHYGMDRIPLTMQWLATRTNIAKDILQGRKGCATEKVKSSDERCVAAGRYLKRVISYGPSFMADDGKVDDSMPSTRNLLTNYVEPNALTCPLKTLGVITLYMLFVFLLGGPQASFTMADLGGKLAGNPEDLFLRLSKSDVQNTAPPPSYRSGAGRRLYDVVSVLTGLGVITTSSDGEPLSLPMGCYKSKYIRLNRYILDPLSNVFN